MSDVLDGLPDAPAAAPGPIPKPVAQPQVAPGSAPDPLDALPSIETPLQQAYQDTSKLDPNRAAEVISLARRIGEPEAYVDKNLPDIKKAVEGPDASELKRFADANPEMAKFLMDRRNMAVAKDDLGSLGLFETAHRTFNDAVAGAQHAWEGGSLQEQIGLRSFDQLMGMGTPESQAQVDAAAARLQELESGRPKSGYLARGAYGAVEFLPQIVGGAVEGGKMAAAGVGMAGAASLLAGPGAPAAFAAAARPAAEFGFKFGMAEYNARLMAGLAYHDMKQVRDKDGNPLPDEIARPAAFATGMAAAGLGFIKLGSAMKLIPGGEAFMQAFEQNVPKAVIESQGMGAAIKDFAAKYAQDVAHGTGAMVGITATNTAGMELAKAASGQPFQMATPGEITSRLLETAGDSVLTFGALGFPKATLGLGSALKMQSDRAELAKNLHETLATAAQDSKLLERLPEGFRTAAKQVTDGSTAETTYIPVERFETLLQSKKVDPKAEAARLGVQKEYEIAKETGGDVAIPTADLITTYGKTDMLKEISGDVKYSPEHLTHNEVQEVRERARQALEEQQKASEASVEADAATRESSDRIYSTLKSSYEAAISDGLTPAKRAEQMQVADAAAKFWARRAAVEGPRRGVTPEEWFNSVNPKIEGEKDASQAAREGAQSLDQAGPKKGADFSASPDQIKITSLSPQRSGLDAVLAKRGNFPVTNEATGAEIHFSKENAQKRSQSQGREQSIGLAHLDDIIRAAQFGGDRESLQQGDTADHYQYLYAPVEIEGKHFLAKVTVEAFKEKAKGGESKNRLVFKSLSLDQVERSARHDGWLSPEGLRSDGTPAPDFGESPSISKQQLQDEYNQVSKLYPKGLYQDEESPRGKIDLHPEGAVIKLFRSADASTFMHESAHLWLQDTFDHMLENADKLTEDQTRDWGILKDWLQIEDGQKKLTTEQHEQFARGFEAYLREGKAPSESLRAVFAKFRDWLTAIYKDARGLNVTLTDDVRGVMDRMLATEEEVAQAKEAIGDKPMPELPGVPKEAMDKLARLQKQAHDKAVDQLLAEQMKELRSSHKEFLAKRRAEVEEQLREGVKNERAYKIQDELKTALDDKRHAKSIAKEFLDGKMKEESRGKVEAFAELKGFSSADEMAKVIMATEPIDREVAKRTRIEMAKYADMKDTGAIKDEALRAIHNDKQLELMAAEREILRGLVKGVEISDIARARRAAEAKVEAAEVKVRARDMMRKMNIRGATSYLPLFTAERRAAERAARAMAEGDYERAEALKRQQMLNHALAIESLKISKEVEKWTDYLKDLRTKDPTYFGKEEHFNQVAELLRKIGMGRTDFDPADKKESLAQWAARMPQETNTLNLPDWVLDDTKVKPMKELTINELGEVVDALKNITQVARFEDRAYTLDEKASLQQIVHDLSMSAALNGIDKSANKPKMVEGQLDSAKRKWNRYILSLHKIETVLRKMDGYAEGGKWQKIFYDSVYKAANDESRRMGDAKAEMERLWSAYSKKERLQMVNDKFFSEELGTSTTKMHLIMMAMNLGNEGNREKMFGTRPLGVEDAVHWDEHAVMSLLSKHMTERDWQFVQGTWDMINSLWPDTEALHKRVTGFSPEKVEATPLTVKTSDGKVVSLKGGYFPLKEDTRASVRAAQNESTQDPLYTEGNPAFKAMTRTGHTKARTDAKYSVALSPTLIHNHMRDVIHDISFRETVLDLRRILANRDLQETVQKSIGTEGYAFIRDWVGSVAGGNTESTDAIASFVRAMRGKATVATIMMKPGVILQHLANPLLYPGAIEGFGWKEAMNGYFKRGVLNYHMKAAFNWKAAEQTKQFVFELSPFMRDMHESPDRSLSETYKNMIGGDSALQKFAGHLIAGALETSSIPMWLEAYSVASDRGLESEDAVAYADRLVSRVQGSGRKYDAPGIQRGGELGRTMAMYMTFLNAEFNRWAAEKGQLQIDKKTVPGMLGFLGSRLLLFSTVSGLLGGKFFKDENSDESVVQAWLKESLGMPMAMFPGLRDISSVALDQVLGIKSMGYHPSPAYTAIETGLDTLGKGGKYLKGETEGQQVVESATKSAAYIFGYPDMINQWIWNGYDYYANGMKPEVKDLYHRRPKRER